MARPAPLPPPRAEFATDVSGSGEDIKVLFVDDQAANMASLEALIPATTCTLVWAPSAEDALLALLTGEFAAIIMDVHMPGMNGWELAELIKQRRRTRDVPVLFLTAQMIDERDLLRGYGTGAVDYLTKPVRPEVLRSKLAVFVELFRKSRTLEQVNRRLQHEINERERMQGELRRANEELEQRVIERTDALLKADQRKDAFLASLAHELRNPLAPIRAAVEVMQRGASDAAVSRAQAAIVRQVDQMRRLVDDLLDVSRITSDKLVLHTELTELSAVVSSAVETVRPLIRERHHDLRVSLPPAAVPMRVDAVRLAQVLSNLLGNAAKFTAPHGTLSLTAETSDEGLTVRIRDNGIGIAPDLLPRIFDMFQQGESGEAAGGLGVGLSLARRIVELHGGDLKAFSAGQACGSEFVFRLPLASEPCVPRSEPLPLVPLRDRLRILVVDDNRDATEMTALLLDTWGQESRVAHDGPSALAMGPEFKPELVLLDIGLPAMDGYETARRIRAEPWGKDVMLVAMTGWGQACDLERSRQAGFDHHLVKPVPPALLRSVIGTIPRPDRLTF